MGYSFPNTVRSWRAETNCEDGRIQNDIESPQKIIIIFTSAHALGFVG
jgi:hypothetical protein